MGPEEKEAAPKQEMLLWAPAAGGQGVWGRGLGRGWAALRVSRAGQERTGERPCMGMGHTVPCV